MSACGARAGALGLILLGGALAGCGSEDFPGAPGLSGDLNVPYVTTYNFGFEVRFDPIGGVNGNLLIISSSDLLNLISAANITRVPGTGVISGRALTTTQGISAQNVVLVATDINGTRLGEFFYNSLGGTPDFVQTRGTTAAGGFTAFNVAPGEVFLKAVAGGRGATRLLSFPDEVSLGTVMVTPVVVPVIGVVGEITDEVGRAVTGPIAVEVVGQRLSEAATCADERPTQDQVDSAQVGGTAAFRFCVASEGDYFARLSGNGYVPTYQFFDANNAELTALQTAELTEFFTIQTRAGLEEVARAAGTTWDPSKGVVTGQIRYGAGAPRSNAKVRITNEQGEPLVGGTRGVLAYLDELGRVIPDPPAPDEPATGPTGRFVAFNLPIPASNTAYITATVQEDTAGVPARYAATAISPVLPNGAVFWGIDMVTLPPPVTGDEQFSAYFTGPLSGQVIRGDGLGAVGNAWITVLGIPKAELPPPQQPLVFPVNAEGQYAITIAGDPRFSGDCCPTDKTPLLQSALYLAKVEGPTGSTAYRPTYQRVTAGTAEIDTVTGQFKTRTQNLFLVEEAAINGYAQLVGVTEDLTKGVLIGTVVDLGTNLPASGISLRLTGVDGTNGQSTAQSSLYYFDFGGVPDPSLTATTADGRFIVFNVPPGAVSLDVTSLDDTGNALADSRAGGVTVMRIDVNNALTETVGVSGRFAPLAGQLPGSGQITLTAAGGDPMAHRMRCPIVMHQGVPVQTVERGGICYADVTDPSSFYDKEPIPCTDQAVYGPHRVQRDPRDEYCQLRYGPASPSAPFTVPIGSSSDVTLKTSGPGFMDTYTFGLRTGDRAVNDVTVGAVTVSAIDAVAASGNLTRTPGSGVIWGQTTTASLGTVNPQTGAVEPITCDTAGWTARVVGCTEIGTPGAFVTGYFNADIFRDLAIIDTTPSTAPRVTIWLNTGGDSFLLAQEIWRNPQNNAGDPCNVKDVGCGIEDGPVALLVVDYTRDGLSDLVVLNQDARTISLLEGKGQGQFVFGGSLVVGLSGSVPNALASADFNLDGIPDLLITDRISGGVGVLYGTGSGFRPPLTVMQVGADPRAVVSGHLDFDGIPDLVFVNRDTITVVLQTGLNTYPVPSGSAADLSAAAIGDLDGDRFNDVVVADRAAGDPRIWIFLNGGGVLQSPTSIPAGPQPPIGVALTDLNRDRSLDLVVIHQDGTLLYRQGDGLGGFGPQQIADAGQSPVALVMDDVTGDGAVDAVLSDPGANRIAILPSTERPVAGVAVAAVQADGQAVGDLVYLDAQGSAVSGATVTGESGRFAIFNIPPGPVWLRLLTGGLGSRFLHAYADAVTNTRFPIITGLDATTTISGVTADAVLRPVGEVQIRFLGTQRATSSNPIVRDSRGNPTGGADYAAFIEANSDYIVKLSK